MNTVVAPNPQSTSSMPSDSPESMKQPPDSSRERAIELVADSSDAVAAPGESAGAAKSTRPRKRSRARIEQLQRRQADLLKPEGRTKPVGTRLEPSLFLKWEAEAAAANVSGSALLYVAVREYLHGAEQRSLIEQMQQVGRVVAEAGAAVVGAHNQVSDRIRSLEELVAKLTETVATQEARFITVDDLEEALGAGEDTETGGRQ